jgi:hypothetical protein
MLLPCITLRPASTPFSPSPFTHTMYVFVFFYHTHHLKTCLPGPASILAHKPSPKCLHTPTQADTALAFGVAYTSRHLTHPYQALTVPSAVHLTHSHPWARHQLLLLVLLLPGPAALPASAHPHCCAALTFHQPSHLAHQAQNLAQHLDPSLAQLAPQTACRGCGRLPAQKTPSKWAPS